MKNNIVNNRKNLGPLLLLLVLVSTLLKCGLAQQQSTSRSKSYPITTLVNAKWEQTPIHLEIAEYLADENPNLYWDFVKDASDLDTPLSSYDTESQSYNAALKLVRKVLTEIQIPLMKLIVSMHSLTPRIQTHFQIASEVLNKKDTCSDSSTFAQVGSELSCTFEELRQKLNSAKKDDSLDSTIETYAFDHIYPGSENNTRTVVLYGDLGSSAFAQFHYMLSAKALSGNIRYITRHYLPPKVREDRKRVRLSGYGVELHLKSTEYKSQDDAPKPAEGSTEDDSSSAEMEVQGFDFKVLKTRFPAMSHFLDKLRQSLLQDNDEIAQLKAWEFQDLGLQAAQAIAEIDGEEALKILQLTAHNFPMQARALLSHKVSQQLRDEVKHNTEVFGRSLNIVPPDSALFINGLFFDADSMDLNSLIETLRTEVRVLESLHNSQVKGKLASSLLALDFSGSGSKEFAIDIRDSAITWINDIEQDVQYRRWPSSVMDLLRPTFPGMLRNIRKNVFNLVLVVDPLQPSSRSLIKLAESFVLHLAPVRLGLVFDARTAATEADQEDYLSITCAFNYVIQKKDARSGLSFLTDIFTDVDGKQAVKRKHIKSQLKKSFDRLSGSAIDAILDEDSDYDYGRQLALEFVDRLGFSDSPQALLNGVPMPNNILSSDSDFEEAIFSEIIQQTTTLQKAVYRGDLTDSEEIMDYLMNQPHVMPRLNQRILGNNENAKFLDLSGTPHNDLNNVKALALLSNRDMTATLLKNIKYFEGKHSYETIGDSKLHFLTLWLFADLENANGKELLRNALQYVRAGASVRVAFVPNVEGSDISRKDNLNRLVWAAQQSLKPKEAADLVLKWFKQPSDKWEIPEAVSEILSSTELHVKILRVYAQRVLNLNAAERLVIGNGKIIGPILETELFGIEDFGLIDRFNAIQYADKLRKALTVNSDEIDSDFNSDTLLKLYASLLPRQTKTRFKLPEDVKEAHSVVKLSPNYKDLPSFEINAIVDPASRSAQKLGPILILLRNTINCHMKVFLTPVSQHSDMPVKNFYRYVVEPEVQFLPSGELAEGPIAKFTGVPAKSLLTQNLQVPENWLVEVVRSVYDLDNIKLSDINGPVHSEFELEYLLLEGHCFDSTTGAPPRGLQVTLGTMENPTLVDTIVMANLGYFQLKANPGVWTLRLREGKSADIYDITFAEGPNTVHKNTNTQVVISSLKSHVIKMRVTKKQGMTNADLLDDDGAQQQSGIWNSIASSFGGGSSSDEDTDTINIFSVASGHLYERLLRIMMVSAMKHTKSPVKFWFLKNYLSPQFTDFLPHMSKEYGFQYELVQYKWPRWLHQQTEKQRTIWGYKILFLDVLFPLNVRKIVFVDADAIVRADLKDLYDMDLGGAPYAYTPFCDSRKEMEGFRFWKQGYWKSHLMGRRYHISALYVVDLKRFRKIAAGDRLRGQYQALSQDPNSLSNLDQDLPNNMIHQVAIKSLPDEWLWCQTWCSDSAFKNAKVIDLCNNPMTKEAKLTAAQRIVPEWKDYDSEVKSLMARIEDHENLEHDESSNEKPPQPIATEEAGAKHSEL